MTALVPTPHVLVCEQPNGWSTRVALERELGRRGWRLVHSPAGADVIVLCGRVDTRTQELAVAASRLLPYPLAPVVVSSRADLASTMVELATHVELRAVPSAPDVVDVPGSQRHTGPETDEHHESMDMGGPGGVPLAEGELDRDGLSMDVLHLGFGPITTLWPPGLGVETSLQGDVIVEAQVHLGPGPERVDGPTAWAYRLDAAAQLVALAGAQSVERHLRAARDVVLDGADPTASAGAARRRVRSNVLLRWSLRGVGMIAPALVGHDALEGDAWDRLLRLVDSSDSGMDPTRGASRDVEATLASLLTGVDVASARLIVASTVPAARLCEQLRERR